MIKTEKSYANIQSQSTKITTNDDSTLGNVEDQKTNKKNNERITNDYFNLKNNFGFESFKPEIISFIKFLPLYSDSGKTTKEYEYIKLQDFLSKTKFYSAINLLQTYEKTDSSINNTNKLINSLNKVIDYSNLLFSIKSSAEELKLTLNIRDSYNKINYIESISNSFYSSYQKTSDNFISLFKGKSQVFQEKFNVNSILEFIGYKNTKNWSVSKLWSQLVYETGYQLCNTGVYTLYGSPLKERNFSAGNSQTVTNSHSKLIPTFCTKLNSSVLNEFKCSNIYIKSSLTSYSSLNQFLPKILESYKNEHNINLQSNTDNIVELSHMISKEFNFSNMQKSNSFNLLKNKREVYSGELTTLYDRKVGIFDSLFNIRVPDVYERDVAIEKSFSKICRNEFTNNLGLHLISTFEPTTLINVKSYPYPILSGGEYYADSIFDIQPTGFNIKNLQSLIITCTDNLNDLKTLLVDSNLFFIENDNLLSNPTKFLSKYLFELIDQQTGLINSKYSLESIQQLEQQLISKGLPGVDLISINDSKNGNKTPPEIQTAFDAAANVVNQLLADAPIKAASVRYQAFLSYANKNRVIKSNLFFNLMCALMLLNKEKNKPVQENLNFHFANACAQNTDSIFSELKQSNFNKTKATITKVPQTDTLLSFKIDKLEKALSMSITAGTLQNTIVNFMSLIYDQLTSISSSDEKTLFSESTNITILSYVFDIICLIADQTSEVVISEYVEPSNSSDVLVLSTIKRKNLNELANNILIKSDTEISLTRSMLLMMYETLNNINSKSKKLLNDCVSDVSSNKISELLNILGSSEKLKLLSSDPQLRILNQTTEESNISLKNIQANTFNRTVNLSNTNTCLLDDSIISPELIELLFNELNKSDYRSSKAFNKKILTIGIPNGFSSNLKSRIDVNKTILNGNIQYQTKQNDIIRINVYKTDLEYQDIIFKPISFLFELSRFIPKNQSNIKVSKSNIIDIISTSNFDGKEWRDITDTNVGLESFDISDEYDFLSKEEKIEILENHIMSFLYELYIRTLTGLDVNEKKFIIEESSSTFKFINENYQLIKDIQEKLDKQKTIVTKTYDNEKSLFYSNKETKYAKKQPKKGVYAKSIIVKNEKNPIDISNELIDVLQSVPSKWSDENSILKYLLMPKKFERVFNIIIDPDDFEIDYEKTTSTKVGIDSLNKLEMKELLTSSSDENNKIKTYKLKEKQLSEGEYSLERYFVSIESFDK